MVSLSRKDLPWLTFGSAMGVPVLLGVAHILARFSHNHLSYVTAAALSLSLILALVAVVVGTLCGVVATLDTIRDPHARVRLAIATIGLTGHLSMIASAFEIVELPQILLRLLR